MPDISNTAAYWMGWQAYFTKAVCPFQEGQDRIDWANGFALAYRERKEGKIWYRSKTLWAGAILVAVGLFLWRVGGNGNDSGLVAAGFGGGMSASTVLKMFLQMVSRETVVPMGDNEP